MDNFRLKFWTKEETTIVLYLYFKISHFDIKKDNPKIIKVAKLINRSINSIIIKLGHFAKLDGKINSEILQLSNPSKLDKEIYQEFKDSLKKLYYERNKAIKDMK